MCVANYFKGINVSKYNTDLFDFESVWVNGYTLNNVDNSISISIDWYLIDKSLIDALDW